jgi:hypothetical protein
MPLLAELRKKAERRLATNMALLKGLGNDLHE